jgi:hypothetical protein
MSWSLCFPWIKVRERGREGGKREKGGEGNRGGRKKGIERCVTFPLSCFLFEGCQP